MSFDRCSGGGEVALLPAKGWSCWSTRLPATGCALVDKTLSLLR